MIKVDLDKDDLELKLFQISADVHKKETIAYWIGWTNTLIRIESLSPLVGYFFTLLANLAVAISSSGVFFSEDKGKTWSKLNNTKLNNTPQSGYYSVTVTRTCTVVMPSSPPSLVLMSI